MKQIPAVILLMLLTGCSFICNPPQCSGVADPKNVYFTTQAVEETEAYQIYSNQFKDQMAIVQYLVNLVRYSPLQFMRNGQTFDGVTAGQWLDFKVDKYRDEIETVEDFIEKVGTYSRRSGREYLVIVGGNARCSMKQVFYNELERLRKYEEQQEAEK